MHLLRDIFQLDIGEKFLTKNAKTTSVDISTEKENQFVHPFLGEKFTDILRTCEFQYRGKVPDESTSAKLMKGRQEDAKHSIKAV